jgi:subtilisin family serine protease
MNIQMKKSIFLQALATLVFTSCSTLQFTGNPIDQLAVPSTKIIDWEQVNTWQHADIKSENFPGMSVRKVYNELLQNKEGKAVVVAVIDTGIDITHEDLSESIWVNEDELPNNGIDDDGNGYVDDVHGWNYLGDSPGDQYELIRLLKTSTDFENKDLAIEKYAEMISKEDVIDSLPIIMKNLSSDLYYYENNVKQAKQLGYNARTTGDDPDDFSQQFYGDENVMPKSDDELHGTHVAGIIAAVRDNGLGMDGVSSTAKIMCLRAVPNEGDEYDKDIALSIRYAADNGAQIINMSFGKDFSPHSDKVREAIVYAESKGVLLVNAAGNDGVNIDEMFSYPNDNFQNEPEVSSNFITIGAIGPVKNPLMIAPFSNFGKYNLDLFAPGAVIYAPVPSNQYETLSGTSMAAPSVSGVAALVLSYYPKLSPKAVRKVLMESVVKIDYELELGYERVQTTMDAISKTGGVVNAYNALLYASDHYKTLRKL